MLLWWYLPSNLIVLTQVPGGKLTSAQQAKLRAEAVQQTHMFFAQSKTGKHEENVSNILSQDKNGMPSGSVPKLTLPNSGEEDKEKQSSSEASATGGDGKESSEGGDMKTVEEWTLLNTISGYGQWYFPKYG